MIWWPQPPSPSPQSRVSVSLPRDWGCQGGRGFFLIIILGNSTDFHQKVILTKILDLGVRKPNIPSVSLVLLAKITFFLSLLSALNWWLKKKFPPQKTLTSYSIYAVIEYDLSLLPPPRDKNVKIWENSVKNTVLGPLVPLKNQIDNFFI